MPIRGGVIRESKIERATVAWAKDNGIQVVKIQGARGWPDRLFLYRGRAMFIEFKASDGGRLSVMQERVMEQLEATGFVVHVHSDTAAAITSLKLFKRGSR